MDTVYDFCLRHNLLLIVDGAQGAGTTITEFNRRNYPNMVYGFTGHKSLYGPQGTGGLLFIGDFLPEQVFTGGSGINSYEKTQPNFLPDIFEYGTLNVHSNIGLRAGVEYLEEYKMERVVEKLSSLKNYFLEEVKKIEGITLYFKNQSSVPIVSLNLLDYSSSALAEKLWEKQIATRAGAHCAPLLHTAMGTKNRGMVRFSFSTFNTFEEIERTVEVLKTISSS